MVLSLSSSFFMRLMSNLGTGGSSVGTISLRSAASVRRISSSIDWQRFCGYISKPYSSTFSSAGAILRARLESLGALLAPQITHMEEAQARAAINEHVEAAQRAAAQAVEKLAQEYGGAA